MKTNYQAYRFQLIVAFLLMFLVLFNACKKDEANNSGEVKLQVTEYGSNAPVKKAFVGLLQRTSNGIGSSASWEVLQSGITDSNGNVNFGNYNDWGNLYIDVQHPNYYDISTINFEQVKSQQSKIVLNGMAYLKLVFVPDSLNNYPYRVLSHDGAEKNCCPNDLVSASKVTERICFATAHKITQLNYFVYRDYESYQNHNNILFDSTINISIGNLLDTNSITIKF